MSLFRQLWLTVIVSMVLAFGGSFAVSMFTARSYLEQQLTSKNQDNAASLALSGPAGGVVGAAAVLRVLGIDRALTIDIGGTSADVGVILGGAPLVESGGSVAGVPIALPRVLVETVSAGGGSILWVDDGGALRVGPRSAGAVLERAGSETDAYLRLPPATLDTRVSELVEQQLALTDYRLKQQVKTFWDFLSGVQEVRQGVREARHKSAG